MDHINEWGGPNTFPHFAIGWALASNTPFQWTKQVASHFGGTRNPMIVSWPTRIKEKGGLRNQFMHVIDIAPTLYEIIGITPPLELNGVTQKPIEGISFAYTFNDAKAKDRHRMQYFEMGTNRALYQDGWMASAVSVAPWSAVRDADPDKQKWELYNIDKDFTQADDLAASEPEKLRELQDLWWAEASKHNVLPMDWRVAERFSSELAGRPSLSGDAKTLTYYEGQVGLPPEGSPRVLNKSWTITADVEIPASGAEGMIVTQGGNVGGYGLYLREGKPTFVYNYLSLDRTTIGGNQPLPVGKVQLKVDFVYKGGPKELGKAAVVTLSANGSKIAEGQVPKTIPATISIQEGLDIGEDVGSPVDFTYKPPFKFTGKIERVTFDLK
jgi:hypothetical protein